LNTFNCIRTFIGHEDEVWNAEKISNEKLVSCSFDKTIRIWNLNSAEDWVTCIVKLSNENIVSCSEDKTIKVWNVNTGECLKTIEDSEKLLYLEKLSNDKIISHSKEGISKLFDVETGKCLKTYNFKHAIEFI